jgi:hypothetical protein
MLEFLGKLLVRGVQKEIQTGQFVRGLITAVRLFQVARAGLLFFGLVRDDCPGASGAPSAGLGASAWAGSSKRRTSAVGPHLWLAGLTALSFLSFWSRMSASRGLPPQ